MQEYPIFKRPPFGFNFDARIYLNTHCLASGTLNPQGAYNDDYGTLIFYGLAFFSMTYIFLTVVEFDYILLPLDTISY